MEHERILDMLEADAAHVKKTGGPAFPTVNSELDPSTNLTKLGADGMSLRDWFAGQAMLGMVRLLQDDPDWIITKRMAEWSYRCADKMLAERAK